MREKKQIREHGETLSCLGVIIKEEPGGQV